MGTYFTKVELARLAELRGTLLGIEGRPAGEEAPRYWRTAADIALYDRVFAARIGWKWDAVLDEVGGRGGLGAPKSVLDWGTGTGAAIRAVLRRLPEAPERVFLFDRDQGALRFAVRSLESEFPGLSVEASTTAPNVDVDLCLASHVLDELDAHGESTLAAAIRRAAAAIWVEPGSKITSRRLSAARDHLLDVFDVQAPCTHRAACGILGEGHASDWCHHFAPPPPEIHTTGAWSEIGRELKIDLRSLPYAFVALRRDPVPKDDGLLRRLGRPRIERGRALVDLCDESGVHQEQLLQRANKALHKELKKTRGAAPLLRRTPGGFEEPA